MDNSGAATNGDDQGSGWFEVKKKHRISSKFSIQNWIGVPSRQQVSKKGADSNIKNRSHFSKPGKDVAQKGVASQPFSKENAKEECGLGKRVVGGDSERPKTPPLKIITTTSSQSSSLGNGNVSEKKPDVVHKIKWGDLEDDELASDHGSSVVSEIRFGEIGDDDLAKCMTSRNCELSSCNISKDCHVVHEEIVKLVDATGDSSHTLSSPIEGSLEDNCNLVSEVASTNEEILSRTGKIIEAKVNDKESAKNDANPLNEDSLRTVGPPDDESLCSPAEELEKIVEVSEPILMPTEVNAATVDGAKVIIAQAPEVTPSDQIVQKAPGDSNSVTADSSDLLNTTEDSSSNARIVSTIGGPEEGESKERFRERLWSFLFENLNRAIDELYLLCELECDLEQVKEAILVLQEAESDFSELNTRVEEFDKMKKNSVHSTHGSVMNLKGDHRRPHALSWEVRRMTTSPHRAEILSSSLEAFKKIQEERGKVRRAGEVSVADSQCQTFLPADIGVPERSVISDSSEMEFKSRRKSGISNTTPVIMSRERRSTDSGRSGKTLVQNGRNSPLTSTASDTNTSKLSRRGSSTPSFGGKGRKEHVGSLAEVEKFPDSREPLKRYNNSTEKEKERDRRNSLTWKPADAWKEKRNWEEILASPSRLSSRLSHSPCMSRKSAERARILHDKLMSPEKKRKTALDLKKEAEEKHARATRIRSELETERVQKLQRTSEKLNRVSEWQADRSMKLKEGMHARHQRSETRHEAYIAKVVKRAGDETVKVNEVRFITTLIEENKKLILQQKLQDSQMRRAEKSQVMKTKQKEDMAREEAVMERRKLIEAEKSQRLAEMQRRKEEALLRREEERKASSAAREARAMEQLRRKEERAKAQQEEAELLAQRLAERLSESEQRRKVYLEQIRERASINFRDQSSPLMRRSVNKEGQGRTTPPGNVDGNQANTSPGGIGTSHANASTGIHQSLKRRIKKIRQRLMALKHELPETPAPENVGIGYRTAMTTARAKIGRWIQELQRLRQERKEGAGSIGLIAAEMIKFLEGKELELQASRRAGLLDFISSALPASHISKPEACQVTIYLLKLLKVALSVPANRSYFLAQNLLPPLIPMLSAALESYIKIAASLNIPANSNSQMTKSSSENFDSISEVLDGFLWTVMMIIGLPTSDERLRQMQDGLLCLLVSYQIIHRLRDLFALYDRPQVEGSPFPSLILLSINLLVVLTSRPCAVSSIDWECCPLPEIEAETFNLVKSTGSGCLLVNDSENGSLLPSSVVNHDLSELASAKENKHVGELHSQKLVNDSIFSGDASEKENGNSPMELSVNDNEAGVEFLGSTKGLGSEVLNINISEKDKDSLNTGTGVKDAQPISVKQPHSCLLSAIDETGLVSLPSLLTAVLLQANNKLSSDQGLYVLPSNFEEVATGVLKVLNNMALMDITFMQQMLARPDLKMEFFHFISFLLTHCTNRWKVTSDQVGLLLLESLLLLGYFSLFHPGNQAVLRWGNSPTILHKVCDLPFAFFSDPDLMPILAGTLVAACYGCEQNKGVVQQELSTEMILSLVKSSRSDSPPARSRSPTGNHLMDELTENSSILEPRKLEGDTAVKSVRSTIRSSRLSLGKSGALGSSNSRISKLRNPKEPRANNLSEEATPKPKLVASEAPVAPPLYSRFPESFIDRAEQFFTMESSTVGDFGLV